MPTVARVLCHQGLGDAVQPLENTFLPMVNTEH